MLLGSMVAPFALTRQASVALEEAVVALEEAEVVGSCKPNIKVVTYDF